MATLETRRSLLEDLEIIEDAVSSRIGRNPEIYYSYLQKRASVNGESLNQSVIAAANANRVYKCKRLKRNKKQIVLQQHEIDLFLKESLQKLKSLGALQRNSNIDPFRDENSTFEKFEQNLHEIKERFREDGDYSLNLDVNEKISQYAMFSSSSTAKPTTILSRKARDLQINDIFTREEQYGELLDLERFHSSWFGVIRSTECSLLKFFSVLEVFLDDRMYLLSPPMDRKNLRYVDFLIKISSYLERFFKKVNVLIDGMLLDRQIQSEFDKYVKNPLRHESKGFYCVVCCKWFKVQSVFDYHMPGKGHKKNLNKRNKGLFAEYKVHRYLTLLKEEFMRTRNFTERKLAFTADERMEEMARQNREYQASDYREDEKEEDGKPDTFTNPSDRNGALEGTFDLPLGPDGLPMPYWLYKLQGLDVTYSCEICSNQTYKGRRAFEKHFLEPTHTFHLRCLGIEPSPTFKGITSIRDAQELWKQRALVKGGQTQKTDGRQPSIKMDIEVEDQDGNVMSQRVYEELKKQGLV